MMKTMIIPVQSVTAKGSSTVMESEHNTITRKELEENKKTTNDITRKLEVQEC